MRPWTNDEAIKRWAQFPREVLDAMEPDGDFARRHLLNPALLRLLGDMHGQRILDAGCGHGYLSRMLAARGAQVTGVEPAQALYDYATSKETGEPRGIRYVQADLCQLPDLGAPFDAVVANMVLLDIPDWAGAMNACVAALAPGGLFVFSIIHPCFEQLAPSWREHGEYRISEYFTEYEIHGPYGPNFHRPLSAYLNELARLGCQLRELAEPALDPAVAATAGGGADAYVHLPNFLIVAARRALPNGEPSGPSAAACDGGRPSPWPAHPADPRAARRRLAGR
jgi:SAM-dependent methyltransferase